MKSKERSVVQGSLHENEDGSSDEWETVDLNEKDLENNDSNDGNLYRQQIAGMKVDDLPTDCLKVAIAGLPVPTTFKEGSWTTKKASLKSELLLKRIKHLQRQGIVVHTSKIHLDRDEMTNGVNHVF